MAQSSADNAKSAVITLLQGAAALNGVQVTYGFPGRNIEREWVCLLGVEWESDGWATIGNRQREEVYRLGLYVNVQKPGGTQQDATERAFALLGAVEDVLRANTTLGVSGVWSAEVVPRRVDEIPIDNGFEAQIASDIRVKCRK